MDEKPNKGHVHSFTLGLPAESDPADTKSRLREVALDLFGRQGIHATSTREIIKAAGMKNPSAITYYFGSKAKLIEELTREVNGSESALLQQHVAFAERCPPPRDPAAWAAIGVDFVVDLMSTERGCRLIRVWSENDDMDPDRVERFLAGPHPLAAAWRDAVTSTFPDLPPLVAIARNVVVIRTLQWITIRRARRLVDDSQHRWHSGVADLHPFLLELSINILAGPTTLTDDDLTGA
jgi:AcrR family transcriptional regulator